MKKYSIIMTVVLLVLGFGHLVGQNSVAEIYLNAETDDMGAIKQSMAQYFSTHDKGQGSGYKQWKRWEYLMERRLTPDGKVTNWALRNWEAYNDYIAQHPNADGNSNDAANGYWYGIGPWNYTLGAGWNGGVGRINCITFHPTLANTFWVGTPAGGLWKTDNGGVSWTPLTDGMPVIGVSGIAVDYTNTNVLYILTGDGDGGQTTSIGVLKTTDGGETWMNTDFTYTIYDNLRGYKLIMHPTNHNILLVVSNAGIHRTTNGGLTWVQEQAGNFQDIEFKPGDPTILYASGGTQFLRSTNSGDTWTRIYSGVPTTAWRMAIGVTPANADYVYLFTGPPTSVGHFVGCFRSVNSGVNFSTRSTAPNLLGYDISGNDDAHQTGYDLAMTVSRTNADQIIVGGINTWRSLSGGSTGSWTLSSMWDYTAGATKYTHADIHGLEINPLNNNLFCVSDGGIFRSTDFGLNWTDITDGISNTQWYRIAGIPSNSNLIIGGTQDNGSNKWNGTGIMEHIRGADGMDCMIDYNNSNILYTTRQEGGLEKSIDGGANFTWNKPAGSWGSWITPFIMNPSNPLIIYGGYINSVYRSSNGGSSWVDKGAGGCSAMAIGTDNPARVYAAMDTGWTSPVYRMWRSDNSGDNWTSIRAGLPSQYITYIAVDPDNSLNVFVTFGGYSAGQKVYHSTNGGASWTNFSGSLPNVAVNCIVFKDNNGSPGNAVYVGTDIGVFYRDNNHADWIPFRNGLPTVPVFDLEIHENISRITAGTFGRGLWRSELYSACASDYSLSPANDPSNPNYTGFQFYEASNSVLSSRTITGGLGTDVTYKAGNYVKLTTGFNAREHNVFKASLGNCISTLPASPQFRKVTGSFIGTLKN